MNTEKDYFPKFLDGRRKEFFIPVYQRNYDWKKEQCQQLWDDLVMLINDPKRYHFFGCIVSFLSQEIQGIDRYIIIDGQQRLTTISILYMAIAKLLKEQEPEIYDDIHEIYLSNKDRRSVKLKLKLIKSDNEIYEKLYKGEVNIGKDTSRILDNYRFFEQKLRDFGNAKEMYNAIDRLEIVHIKLEHNDDPQLIFESLNSTGLALTEADKIRNYILMGLKEDEQNRYFEDYWSLIEKNTDFDVSSFIKDYLSYVTGTFQSNKVIYLRFKKYFLENDKKANICTFFEELKKFSGFYSVIKNCNYSNDNCGINECLKSLKRLEMTITYPYLLSLFSLLEQNKISQEVCKDVLSTIESYLFRRFICELPTSGLGKIFIALERSINKYISSDFSNYSETFKKVISSISGSSGRYPKDEEFLRKLTDRNIYEMRSKARNFLFDKLENCGNSEKTDLENSNLTIEHIMPQTLTPLWEKELGDDFQNVHIQYLHKLGNLTYTGYNSKYGNKSFNEKKTIEGGFLQSRLFLNEFVKQQNTWSEKEITERGNLLAERALKIWPHKGLEQTITTDRDVSPLDEDFDFSGYKPQFFFILGEKHSINSWRNLYRELLKSLYEIYESDLMKILKNQDLDKYIANGREKLQRIHNRGEKILPQLDLYFDMNFSANDFMKRIRSIFESLDLDIQELSIRISKE